MQPETEALFKTFRSLECQRFGFWNAGNVLTRLCRQTAVDSDIFSMVKDKEARSPLRVSVALWP